MRVRGRMQIPARALCESDRYNECGSEDRDDECDSEEREVGCCVADGAGSAGLSRRESPARSNRISATINQLYATRKKMRGKGLPKTRNLREELEGDSAAKLAGGLFGATGTG